MRLFSTAVAAAVLLNLPGLALTQEASVPTDNAVMAAIFVADQAVRQNIDPARFRDRAFVFQHGSTPEDYLLAHSLAVTGVAKGSKQAAWIAAASLDRFLQSVDRKQIYGTQPRMMNGGEPTLESYDRDLLPAAVRAAAGVPNLVEQDARLEQFRVARQAAAPQP